MSRLFDRLFGGTVDAPLAIGVLILSITAFSVMGRINPRWIEEMLTRAPVEAPVEEGPPAARIGASPETSRAIPNVDAVSLTDADVILVLESESFFTQQGVKALRAIVRDLEQLETVRDVFWLERVPVLNLFGLRESLFPGERASPRQYEVARERAIAHPLVGGQLLSADGRTLLLMIKLDWLFVADDADCTTKLKQVATATAAQFPEAGIEMMITGRVPMYLTFIEAQTKNRWWYQMIGYGMTALMALVLFRGIRAVIIVGVATSLGVFWTIGILRYFDLQDNPFNDILLPVLLSLVGLADGVHLLVEIRRQRAKGLEQRAAARAGIVHVGLACALTSITTAIGFGSLALAHHDIVQEFGKSCVLGVFLMFLSVIMVIPLACASPLGRNLHVGQEKGLIDRNITQLGQLIAFVQGHSRLVSGVAILATLLLTSVSLTLRPDERRANALPLDAEVSRAMCHMDAALGGMENSRVRVEWNADIASDAPEVLETLMAVDDVLRRQELIGYPLSLRNFLDALPGEGTAADRFPLVELLPPPLKRAFYEPEKRMAYVDFRVQDVGIARYGPVFMEIEQQLREIEQSRPGFLLTLHGSAVSRWKDLYQIVVDLALSLGSASLIIFLVLTIAYGSLRLGLISLVPNFFPLAVTGTYLVLTGQSLELASVCAFTVCLGIAVDDTIHFLTRFQEERAHQSVAQAIDQAFSATGTALIMTSVILVIGFLTVLFSDLRDQRIFATMGVLTISSALFADLVFLPALLRIFIPSDSSDENSPESREFSG